MELRHPASDTPAWATVGGLAAVCFGIGLALAYWGTSAAPSEESAPQVETSEGPAVAHEPTTSSDSAEDGEPGSDPSEPDGPGSALDSPTVLPPVAEPSGTTASDTEPSNTEPSNASASDTAPSDTAPPTRFLRGRVAYLRCDGAGSGGRCARDEPLEDVVWAVLGRLPECTLPAPGQADLRIAWEGDAPADVLWRDTFADDVVRLDRERVMGCVQAGLAATRPSRASGRLLVSFRFRME
ncbi:MAG: hypothetical protein AB8I08_31545 [Sandaracinaceae bacterium]